MNQDNQTRAYATLGLAGQMGCFIAILALAALFVGIWIDHTFGTRRIAILVCVAASLPINLGLAVMLTQRMIKRIIPLEKPSTGEKRPGEVDNVERDR